MIRHLKCMSEFCWWPNKVWTIVKSNHTNITFASYKFSEAHDELISAQTVYNFNVYGLAWQTSIQSTISFDFFQPSFTRKNQTSPPHST